jgi:mevalonate kinase
MKAPRGTAGGKAILVGEHAVVYGGRAVAMPVPGLQVEVDIVAGDGWDLDKDPGEHAPLLDRARDAVLARAGWRGDPPRMRVRSSLPLACGLGSSAAFSVAMARAVLSATRQPATDASVRAMADAAEAEFHGNPSGVDVATVVRAQPILFQRGTSPAPVPLSGRFDLWVADTGIRSQTSEVVADVARLRQHDPSRFHDGSERIACSVRDALSALTRGEVGALAAAMEVAMGGLRRIGVSHPAIEAVIEAARAQGVLAGKLSGAGRGGVVLLLAPDERWNPSGEIAGARVLTRVPLT